MNINRDNYEAFFLLYVDNELPASDQRSVEEFVNKNPDLKNEFVQFKELVLPAEEIIYTGKNNLYRLPQSSDLLNEKLLLHLDGELGASEINLITPLIAPGGEMYHDWQVLQKAKLNAKDQIVFPYKSLLYRKEPRKIVAVRFMKWAVAAAIVGAGFFVGLSLLNKKDRNIRVAENKVPVENIIPSIKPDQPSTAINIPGPAINTNEKFTATKNAKTTFKKKEQPSKRNGEENKNLANNQRKNKLIVLPVKKEIKSANDNTLLAINKNQNQGKDINPQKQNEGALPGITTRPGSLSANALSDNNLSLVQDRLARTAGLADLTNDKNANRILYLDEENLTRSKTGSFFKQLKRIIERNTKIKTEKGLRIGGFELAVK